MPDCLTLYLTDFEIVHGFRQKNVVADRLAVVAYLHKQCIVVFRAEELPESARRAYLADKIGLWNYRAYELFQAV